MTTTAPAQPRTRRTLVSGLLVGVGAMAFVDEVVFHQVLHWHHFYDASTTDVGLVSDGLLHAGSWFATVAGLFLVADLRRRGGIDRTRWWGAMLAGAGAFQLLDGTVLHKALGLHQIRYGVDLALYDALWIGAGAAFLVVGSLLLARAARRG